MTLGETLAVRTDHHGDVIKRWRGAPQGSVQDKLPVRAGDEIVAPDDFGYPVADVVGDDRELIAGAVSPGYHEIARPRAEPGPVPAYEAVREGCLFPVVDAKAPGRLPPSYSMVWIIVL